MASQLTSVAERPVGEARGRSRRGCPGRRRRSRRGKGLRRRAERACAPTFAPARAPTVVPGSAARVLLLSATPFKHFTCDNEDTDHWSDFGAVMGFLLGPARAAELHGVLGRRRVAILNGDAHAAESARVESEVILRSVMSRHERVGAIDNKNSMMRTREIVTPFDARHASDALSWIRLARRVEHHDALGLWGSAPYAAHFLKECDLSDRVVEQVRTVIHFAIRTMGRNIREAWRVAVVSSLMGPPASVRGATLPLSPG